MQWAKHISDWVMNVILVFITVGAGMGVFWAQTVPQKAVLGLTCIAFAVAAFIIIRFTIISNRESKSSDK